MVAWTRQSMARDASVSKWRRLPLECRAGPFAPLSRGVLPRSARLAEGRTGNPWARDGREAP